MSQGNHETKPKAKDGVAEIAAPCFADVFHFSLNQRTAATFGRDSGGSSTMGSRIIDRDGRIRKVTPIEAERLMGFPDDYTKLDGCTDSQRYEALGNSMVIPVMSWLGQRIHQVHRAQQQSAA
jgi:site-specific DNA-cytosine methylase